MIQLMKDNVERIVENAEQARRLERQGFICLEGQTITETVKNRKAVSESMTVSDLRALAKAQGIEGAASLNKKELLELLKEVD